MWNPPVAVRGHSTCPGRDADPGVEPPEWLGELGNDLQASSAACFFCATIFWAAENNTELQLNGLPSDSRQDIMFLNLMQITDKYKISVLTFWEDSVDIEPVGCAGLIKQRVFHIDAQLPGSLVLNHPRVGAAYFIWTKRKSQKTQQNINMSPFISIFYSSIKNEEDDMFMV